MRGIGFFYKTGKINWQNEWNALNANSANYSFAEKAYILLDYYYQAMDKSNMERLDVVKKIKASLESEIGDLKTPKILFDKIETYGTDLDDSSASSSLQCIQDNKSDVKRFLRGLGNSVLRDYIEFIEEKAFDNKGMLERDAADIQNSIRELTTKRFKIKEKSDALSETFESYEEYTAKASKVERIQAEIQNIQANIKSCKKHIADKEAEKRIVQKQIETKQAQLSEKLSTLGKNANALKKKQAELQFKLDNYDDSPSIQDRRKKLVDSISRTENILSAKKDELSIVNTVITDPEKVLTKMAQEEAQLKSDIVLYGNEGDLPKAHGKALELEKLQKRKKSLFDTDAKNLNEKKDGLEKRISQLVVQLRDKSAELIEYNQATSKDKESLQSEIAATQSQLEGLDKKREQVLDIIQANDTTKPFRTESVADDDINTLSEELIILHQKKEDIIVSIDEKRKSIETQGKELEKQRMSLNTAHQQAAKALSEGL